MAYGGIGPAWLTLSPEHWPSPHRPVNNQVLPESRQLFVVTCQHVVKGREDNNQAYSIMFEMDT